MEPPFKKNPKNKMVKRKQEALLLPGLSTKTITLPAIVSPEISPVVSYLRLKTISRISNSLAILPGETRASDKQNGTHAPKKRNFVGLFSEMDRPQPTQMFAQANPLKQKSNRARGNKQTNNRLPQT
jgi:hypothetical protein